MPRSSRQLSRRVRTALKVWLQELPLHSSKERSRVRGGPCSQLSQTLLFIPQWRGKGPTPPRLVFQLPCRAEEPAFASCFSFITPAD